MQQKPASLFHSLAYSLLIAYCHPIQMVGVETIIMELHTLPVINSWYTLQQLSDAHVHFLVTCSSFISTPLYTRSFVHMCAYDASLIHTIRVLLHVYICGFCRAVPGITACIQYCFLQWHYLPDQCKNSTDSLFDIPLNEEFVLGLWLLKVMIFFIHSSSVHLRVVSIVWRLSVERSTLMSHLKSSSSLKSICLVLIPALERYVQSTTI